MKPKVTHLGPVPTAANTAKARIAGYNPAKISVTKIRGKDVYRGSITMYNGWKIIDRQMQPNGRVNVVVARGNAIAQINGVRVSSISNEL